MAKVSGNLKKCLVNTYSELKNIKELVIFFILNFVLFKEM